MKRRELKDINDTLEAAIRSSTQTMSKTRLSIKVAGENDEKA
jgi:hypothetical protein